MEYLVSYHYSGLGQTGFGNFGVTLVDEVTMATVRDLERQIRDQIREVMNDSSVVILNLVPLGHAK